MANVNSRLFCATAKLMAATLFLSTCAPAVDAAGGKLRSAVISAYIQSTWQPYAVAPTPPPAGGYDVGGPTSPNAATWHVDSLAARNRALTNLNNPGWVRPETLTEPNPGSTSPPAGYGDPGNNSIWSTNPTPTGAGNHMTPATTGGATYTGSGGGPVDGASTALGAALAWQDSFPAGGTLLSPGVVNSLNGNRLATVPIVSWQAKGGIGIDLTLYHNSGGSSGTMWGQGWRSSLDIEIVEDYPRTNPRRATLIFGDGSTIPFVSRDIEPLPGASYFPEQPFSPAVGFYDALTAFRSGSTFTGWVLRRRDGSVLRFNSYGRLMSMNDRRGNTITIGRPAPGGAMTSVTDSAGRKLEFEISSVPGSIYQAYSAVTDPAGRQWKFRVDSTALSGETAPPSDGGGTRYNRVGHLLSITLPKTSNDPSEVPHLIKWGYAAATSPQMVREVDPMGQFWTYGYEFSTGRLNRVTDPLTKATIYATGTTATMTTPRGVAQSKPWTHTYVGEVIAAKKDPAGYIERYHYDARRNRDAVTDRRDKIWRTEYDAYGNMLASQNPEQAKAIKSDDFRYDDYNVVKVIGSARGAITQITPDGNEPKVVVDGDGKVLLNATYNANGELESIVSFGVAQSSMFDSYGRTTSTTTADGTSSLVYNGSVMGVLGMPYTASIPGRPNMGMRYDLRGRVTVVGFGMPGEKVMTLDALGRAIEITNEDGKTLIEYDALSRVKKVKNPRMDEETYTYDDDGFLTDIVRGNGTHIHYVVQIRGDVSEEQSYAAPGTTSQVYVTFRSFDGEGNVKISFPGVNQLSYEYYDDGNLEKIIYPDGFNETYAYDEDGNRTRMTDRSGTTTWTYSAAGRMLTMTSPAGKVKYGYDAHGNSSTVSHAVPGVEPTIENEITTNRVYPSGRVTWYGNAYTNEVVNYTYGDFGRVTSRAVAGGTSTEYGYDTWGRPESIRHKNAAGGVIRNEFYTYEGTRLKTRRIGNDLTTYVYDVAGQLLSETRPGFSAGYTYDRNGNRLSRTVNGVAYTYDYTGDRLDKITHSAGQTKEYNYDLAGRPTSIKGFDNVVRNLNWDADNRLTSAPGTVPGTQVYNGDGARVIRNGFFHRRSGSSVTSPILSDSPSRSHVPGLTERDGGNLSVLLPDRLGTSAIKTEPSGNAAPLPAERDAFGMPTDWNSSGRWNWKGGHGYFDEGGGAYLIGHRWYDADAGRFLTRDPARSGRNWWAYCGNDPINAIDPTGLFKVSEALRKKYPKAASLIEKYKGSKKKKEAVERRSKASKETVDSAFTPGSGPTVNIQPRRRGESPYGNTPNIPYNDTFEINESLLGRAERGDEAAILLLYITLEHETVHWADLQDGKSLPGPGEAGDGYERDVYGRRPVAGNVREDWERAKRNGY